MNKPSSHILIIDDDGDAVLTLTQSLRALEVKATFAGATSPEAALEQIAIKTPSVVILDLSLTRAQGPESGYSVLSTLRERSPSTRVIVLTGHGSTSFGVRAIELGASSFLQKPADLPHLTALVRDGLEQFRLREELLNARSSQQYEHCFIGTSTVSNQIREQILFASKTELPVLITGETGTGKGVCAQAIHQGSNRAAMPFIQYQPRFSSGDLTQSDLFGHHKGAFTGATEPRRGIILEATGGTLFLDEIDQLSYETQVLLLDTVQHQRVRAVGSSQTTTTNFRLLCATNSHLEQEVTAGKFRKDLYHRVSHFHIHLPPLRERREDIALLALHLLKQIALKRSLLPIAIREEALIALQQHSWPGNIRELEAVLEGGAYRAHFEGRVELKKEDLLLRATSPSPSSPSSYAEKVEVYKRQLIAEALTLFDGNQQKAAEHLMMDRSSLRRVMGRAE